MLRSLKCELLLAGSDPDKEIREFVFSKGKCIVTLVSFTRNGIKMYSYIFQCDVLHQWIARHVGPVSVYCDGVECHALCLQHGIHVAK